MSNLEIMATAFDGTRVPRRLDPLPCGGVPEFDDGSGYAYRCDHCGAVIGSIGMPSRCAELHNHEIEQTKIIERLTKK